MKINLLLRNAMHPMCESKHFLPILFLFCGFFTSSLAQEFSSKVVDGENTPIAYATITTADSTGKTLQSYLADQKGEFTIRISDSTTLQLQIAAVGYVPGIHLIDQQFLTEFPAQFVLDKSVNVIDEITIKAQRPLIQQKSGRIIFNVQDMPAVETSTVLEIFQKAPGIFVDQQNESIKLNGKSVLILIDNKRTYLESNQVFDYINTIPASTIASLEIITNPSSKYDAATIINIITKKDKSHGWNTTIFTRAGFNHRKTFGSQPEHKYHGLANYRNSRFALTLSGGGNTEKSPVTYFQQQAAPDYTLDQDGRSVSDRNGYFAKASVEYFIAPQHTVGMQYVRNQSSSESRSETYTLRSSVADSGTDFMDDGLTERANENDVISVNYTAKLSNNRLLQANADYARNKTNTDDGFFTQSDNQPFQQSYNTIGMENNIFSSTIDLEDEWWEQYAVEAGLKYSSISNSSSNTFTTDTFVEQGRSSYQEDLFKYKESILAGYMTVERSLGERTSLQIGLRAERTTNRGVSIAMDSIHQRTYTNLLPSFTMDHMLDEQNSLTVLYSSSVERPSFKALNPFRYYSDIYSASEGNPELRASTYHDFAIRHLLKQKYMFTLAYQYQNNFQSQHFSLDEDNQVLVSRFQNLGKSRLYAVMAYVPISVAGWWSNTLNIQGIYSHISSETLTNKGVGFTISANNTFKLPASYTVEASGQYNYISSFDIYRLKPNYSVNLSVAKSFLNKSLNVKAQVTDLFSLYRYQASTFQNNIHYRGGSQGRGALYSLSLSYKFGKQTVKGSSSRSKSMTEERGRVDNTNVERESKN